MITALSIKNYALIEKLSIDFFKRFFNYYGETGAGKSIILEHLVYFREKSRPNIIENKEEKCIIEAHFEISKYNLTRFF
jgi:DNA repair protein RecN (Recombination protein N)